MANLNPQSRTMMLGVLLHDLVGVDSGLKGDVVRKYRKLAREEGVLLGSLPDIAPRVRLDYDLARMVEEAA